LTKLDRHQSLGIVVLRQAPSDTAAALSQTVEACSARQTAAASQGSADIQAFTTRLRRGEEAAYREFHAAYFSRLLRYLLVITGGREDAARDALQSTFVRVVRHIRPFDSEAAFWSWLTVLARSSLIDALRKEGRYLGLLGRFLQRTRVEAAVESDADAQLLELLESELANLPREDRELMERKYFTRESVKEMAAALALTEKAIESRLVRIRKRLKELVLARLKDGQP
jgi:RNA polymerase sigma-70 factor (ECF subfamily)